MSIIMRGMPDGHAAIYKGPREIAIENDPHADIARVLFHTKLDYTVVQSIVDVTVNLTGVNYDASGKTVYNVHAHGLPYTPLIFGIIKNYQGVPYNDVIGQNQPGTPPLTTGVVPFSGTIVLPSTGWIAGGAYAFRMLQLGCNETHVTVTDVSPYGASFATSYPSSYYNTFPYDLECQVWITKTALPV
ncbi:hypothetical protein [Stappia sp. ES.058]|uniref:hypothetical protein n=1 Tax=Stappia sp. ES.058 TaxID=1881061 RepID=UPI00087B7970|nr:hypothetical protein [Stappia sp. ES.058]SDT97197.1 hypothetical protein SAMN05428979_0820 [Stappia sp. ES.058]